MLKLKTLLLGLSVLTTTFVLAQKKITVEDIWRDYKFVAKSVPGFNFLKDGKHYTLLQSNMVQKYDLTTGDLVEAIFKASDVEGKEGFDGRFDGYSFSQDEEKMLIRTQTRQIYRRSVEAYYYVYDRSENQLSAVDSEAKQRFTTFNPEANRVAYLKGNDLYYKDLNSKKITQITTDGKVNHIINGGSDWVYEEEFSITKAFQWSPDSKNIAFIRFDESEVPEFTMTLHNDDAYPEYQTFKYPKVGAVNAKVSVHIYNLELGKIKKIDIGEEDDIYIPRLFWTKDPNKLCIFKMNRHQNELELILADAQTGKTSTLLKETNKYYIDITDNLTFLEGGEHFIWTSEQDGFHHIYLYGMDGKLEKQLTKGDYDVTEFYGVDEENELVYFQAAIKSPLQREIYSVNLKGKKLKQLSKEEGWNSAQFSSTFDYYVLYYYYRTS
jgi:dipeptidyl-peptidase-4